MSRGRKRSLWELITLWDQTRTARQLYGAQIMHDVRLAGRRAGVCQDEQTQTLDVVFLRGVNLSTYRQLSFDEFLNLCGEKHTTDLMEQLALFHKSLERFTMPEAETREWLRRDRRLLQLQRRHGRVWDALALELDKLATPRLSYGEPVIVRLTRTSWMFVVERNGAIRVLDPNAFLEVDECSVE